MGLERIAKKVTCSLLASTMLTLVACSWFNQLSFTPGKYFCPKREVVVPGNLYFYNTGDFLSDSEIVGVLDGVQDNFCKAGIGFDKSGVFSNDRFPELNGLDILIVFDQPKPGYFAKFGFDLQSYIYMKSNTSFPYNRETSSNNVGFVNSEHMYEETKNLLSYELSRKDLVKFVSQMTTHEIAHGLGASHVEPFYSNLKFYQPYFLGDQFPGNEQVFYSSNVAQMKRFIQTVKSRKLGKKEIFELRDSYLDIEHSIKSN